MALKIIYGVGGSGKTEECYKYIENIVSSTKSSVVYVVPEQYSLEAERNISARFSKSALDRVEVLSLERMAKRVFSTVGPVLCEFLDDNAKLMILERTIIKIAGKLVYFSKNADVPGFASVILQIIKEFKSNCIDSQQIKTIAEQTVKSDFKFKLYDLYLIYSEYERFFDFPYGDSDDNMTLLSEKISKYGLFKNTYFVFDNFVSFSKQQLQVITELMKNSPALTVALTTDDLEYKNKFQLFYKSKLTAKVLYDIAYENNIEILPNLYLEKNFADDDELGFLSTEYFAVNKKRYSEETDSLFILKSDSYNNEIEQVACEIHRLVRECGYRYKDFAVITRNQQVYYPIIRDCFDRYDIFYNITEPKYSNSNFLCSALMSVFDIVINKYSFDSVFEFVRSCLCNLSDDDKFLLENYILEAGNREQIWTGNGDLSYKGSFSDLEFERICNSVEYVRSCISSFTDNFKGRKTVDEIIDAYSKFLEYVDEKNIIKNIVKQQRISGNNEKAEEIVSVYNHIMVSVNQMLKYFKGVYITFEKFYKILYSALSSQEIDVLPSGVDDVIVTSVDRFQALNAKVVFVVGVSDGVIPQGYINEGVFKDEELKILGIDNDVVQRHCDENYLIYQIFSSAEDRLYISYPMADNEANSISPSIIINNIKGIFPSVTLKQNIYEKLNKMEDVEGVLPTFNRVINNGATGFWSTVAEWYKDNRPDYYEIIKNVKNYTNLPPVLRNDVVKKLYGDEIKSSISKVEKYNQCQFAYFIRYGLNIDERKEFKIEAKDYGTYMHAIIEEFSRFAEEFGWVNITDEICSQKASEITKKVLKENLSEFYTESERYTYLFNKIISAMTAVIKNITAFYKQSKYVSLGYEVAFDDNSELKPITLTLSDGTLVKLRGKVDRADIMQTDNGDFVTIVDYKSSAKNIEFEKIICGIQIQLPIYIKAICENLQNNGRKAIPGAMLYYCIEDPIISGDKNYTEEEISREIEDKLKMKGVMHESSDIPGVFVARRDVTINQINKICKVAYDKMKNALESMVAGNINICPSNDGKGVTACKYCPYDNICNFDKDIKNNRYNTYSKVKMEEFFDYADQLDS